MRLALFTLLACGIAAAQPVPGLTSFLGLSQPQVDAVHQLNNVFTQLNQAKIARLNTVQVELAAEYAKPSPTPQALGVRYIEIDSLNRELAAAKADLQTKIVSLLTPQQFALVQNISSAIVQQSLVQDASCAYLADAILRFIGGFAFINTLGGQISSFMSIFPDQGVCGAAFPISIREFLALTDGQVAGIVAIESSYATLNNQAQSRIAEAEAAIRDETAKPTLDAAALGARYAELATLSQQLKQSDLNARVAARSLLNTTQLAKLQTLVAASSLTTYLLSAESCHFLNTPPGVAQLDIAQFPCLLN